MACPTCDHTMQNLGVSRRVFWCSRCGTLKEESACVEGVFADVEVPLYWRNYHAISVSKSVVNGQVRLVEGKPE